MINTKRPAIFLDRDGVLIYDNGHLVDEKKIKLLPGVEDLAFFQEKGFLIIIVSNQSLVARGFITKKKMWKLDRYVRNLLNKVGVKITKSYYCPHYPNIDGDCLCRKPKPGLILQAISEWNLDPDKSFVIGDSLRDIQAGRSAGVRYGILVMKNQKKWNLPDEALKTVEFKKNNIKEALLVAKHLLE